MAARTARPFVAAKIVHDDDVAGHQGGDKHLLDIDAEALRR
jgi:hypothetical protein